MRRGAELAAFGALEVGEEDKAAPGVAHGIDSLQQNHAHVGMARSIDGRERHGVWIVRLVARRVGEPGVEQREWLGGLGEVAGLERRRRQTDRCSRQYLVNSPSPRLGQLFSQP